MQKADLVKVGPENLSECGIGCIKNPGNPGYVRKVEWLRKRVWISYLRLGKWPESWPVRLASLASAGLTINTNCAQA